MPLPTEPAPSRTPEELLAEVYRRAPRLRRRQRRTRAAIAVGFATVMIVLTGVAVAARSSRSTEVVTAPATTIEPAGAALATASDGTPTELVTVGASDGVTVNDATTGARLRTIVPFDMTTPTTSRLGGGTIAQTALSLSTDRRTAYFVTSGGGGVMSVYAVQVSGGTARDVLDFPSGLFSNYAVSPDGRQIAWFRSGEAAATDPPDPTANDPLATDSIVVTDLATGDERTVATRQRLSQTQPAWSADGRELAVTTWATTTELQVQIVDVQPQAEPSVLPTLVAPPGCQYRQPMFRPGSNDLAVIKTCQKPETAAYAGGAVVSIDMATLQERETVLTATDEQRIAGYAFDPTGDHIVFALDEFAAGRTDVWQQAFYRLDRGVTTRIELPPGLHIEAAW